MSSPDADLVRLWEARGVVPSGAVWIPLTGGNTNALWRVGDVVVKRFVPGAETPLFPNDPAAERLALTALHGTGLAPDLIAAEGDSLVYRLVAGQGWQCADGVACVAKALARLHRQPIPDGLPQKQSDVIGDARALGATDLPEWPLNAPDVAPVFLHGDATAANALVDGDSVTFIDWQCPAVGDPCEDISVFVSPAMQIVSGNEPLSRAETETFLEAYGDETVATRYRALAPLFAARMRAYCLWRAARGDAGYAQAAKAEG